MATVDPPNPDSKMEIDNENNNRSEAGKDILLLEMKDNKELYRALEHRQWPTPNRVITDRPSRTFPGQEMGHHRDGQRLYGRLAEPYHPVCHGDQCSSRMLWT